VTGVRPSYQAEDEMKPRYEIFEKRDGHTVWVDRASSLDEAEKRVRELMLASSGEYFIFDTVRARFVMLSDLTTDD
jgi:hypothetical protein